MNIKIILFFCFIFVTTNTTIASNSDDNNCSCWKAFISCCANKQDQVDYDNVYIPLPNEGKNEKSKYFICDQQVRTALKNIPARIINPLPQAQDGPN